MMQTRSRALQRYDSLPSHRSASRQWAVRGVQRLLTPPSDVLLALLDAGVVMAGAIALRVVADLLLLWFPWLWGPVVLLLCSPAGIAVVLANRLPQLSLLLGYRLLLIVLGLWIGGRL